MDFRRLLHVFVFEVWRLSNRNVVLRSPVRFLAQLVYWNFEDSWKKTLRENRDKNNFHNRYVREGKIPTQVLVITDKNLSNLEYEGVSLLLNHIRVPYRVNYINDNPNLSLVIFTDETIYEKKRKECKWDKNTAFIVFSSQIRNDKEIRPNNRVFIKESSTKFLPGYDGLRSEFAARTIKAIRQIVTIPLVTGMSKRSVGLRIDDVKGAQITSYLSQIVKHGWLPNLGIFVDELMKNKGDVISYLSDLDKKEIVSISPHSYSSDDYIFYNYAKGRPFNNVEFSNIWVDVLGKFEKLNLTISPVINAHFHALSRSAALQMSEIGAKYFFSELSVDHHTLIPDNGYWPAGDPVCSTGKIDPSGVYQLSSGDCVLDKLNRRSRYDFLEHVGNYDLHKIRKRILDRLQLSVECGFAAYITTHEYLINEMGLEQNKILWEVIESELYETLGHDLNKESLCNIARNFEVMNYSSLNSVTVKEDSLVVEMIGTTNSADNLTVFSNNNLVNISVPEYKNSCEIVIDYEN